MKAINGIVFTPKEWAIVKVFERQFRLIGREITEHEIKRILDRIRMRSRDRRDQVIADDMKQADWSESAHPSYRRTESIPADSDPHGTLTRGTWRGIPGDSRAFGAIKPTVSGKPRGLNREERDLSRQAIREVWQSLTRNGRKKIKRRVPHDKDAIRIPIQVSPHVNVALSADRLIRDDPTDEPLGQIPQVKSLAKMTPKIAPRHALTPDPAWIVLAIGDERIGD